MSNTATGTVKWFNELKASVSFNKKTVLTYLLTSLQSLVTASVL